MSPIKFITLLSALLIITACGNQISKPAENVDNNTIDNTISTIPPVETEAANTTYTPAFKGQTRIAGIRTKTP
ncbi:MAG: hypothetical protein SH808_07700, partial [Saprospiraceae bacterium]|nr:hypothetical protein [Saprospiraceae bacterium]